MECSVQDRWNIQLWTESIDNTNTEMQLRSSEPFLRFSISIPVQSLMLLIEQ